MKPNVDFVCFCQAGMTQPNAEAQCKTKGLHLATIHNKAENDAIAAVIAATGMTGNNSSVWHGLNSIMGAWGGMGVGTWVWMNGEHVDYRNWLSGEPNNSIIQDPSGERCVAIQADGGWGDFTCSSFSELFGSICGR